MALELVGPDMLLEPTLDGVPTEFPRTPLQQTIDSMLSYADHLEGQSRAMLELAEATYLEHTLHHNSTWAMCTTGTCAIARHMLPY